MVAFHSSTCSRISSSGLNPACSFLSLWSTPPCILLISILPNTLLAVGSNVTRHQFPHCCRFPFFGISHISPVSTAPALSFPAKSGQMGAEFHTGAFCVSLQQFCCYLVDSWCLPILEGHCPLDFLPVRSSVSLSSSSSSSIYSSVGGFGGVFQFKTSSKCSFHLACLSSLFLRSLPSLLVTAAVFLGPFGRSVVR